MWASGSGEDPNTHGLDQTRILGWMDECHPLRSLHPYESDWWPLLRRSSVLTQAGEDCLPVCQPACRALHAFSQACNRWRTGGALNESTEIQTNSYFISEISASVLMYRIFIALFNIHTKLIWRSQNQVPFLTSTESVWPLSYSYTLVISPWNQRREILALHAPKI